MWPIMPPNWLKKFHFSKVTLQFCFEELPQWTKLVLKCCIWPMQWECKVQRAFNTCFFNFNEMCTNPNISTQFQPCNMLFILTSMVLTSTILLVLIKITKNSPVFSFYLGLLPPPIPSFSGICKVRKFYWISVWNVETLYLMHKVWD